MSDEEIENLDLKQKVEAENKLKEFVVDYVGDKVQPESGEVTVEMIVGVFASDFPEFLLAVAEENWIRGYKQAFQDKQIAEEADTQKNEDE